MVCGEWRVMGDGKTGRRQGESPVPRYIASNLDRSA